jgi:hypothetical protein
MGLCIRQSNSPTFSYQLYRFMPKPIITVFESGRLCRQQQYSEQIIRTHYGACVFSLIWFQSCQDSLFSKAVALEICSLFCPSHALLARGMYVVLKVVSTFCPHICS